MLLTYGNGIADGSVIDSAVRLTPTDAETHYARATVANLQSDPNTALPEFELAASLRPRDYAVWFDLGMTGDQRGNQEGALACFNESVRLAPYYASPRWQRGNLLSRMGRYDEAFDDLRQAATADPAYLSNFIDLAWGASRKDPLLTEQIVAAQSAKAHFALALFFARHGEFDEAVTQFGSAGNSAEDRRVIVHDLLSAGGVKQAFTIWSGT